MSKLLEQVDLVQLGRVGPSVSAVGFGAWQAGMKGWGEDYTVIEVRDAVKAAIEAGVNFIDTAEIYGNGFSEEILADIIKHRREDHVLATKVAPWNLSRKRLRRALENSLRRLGTSYIDLYQIHFPPSYFGSVTRPMRSLEALVKDGIIRYLGVSNYSTKMLARARSALSTTDIISDQVEYSLIARGPEVDLMPYCKREGIGIIAYSPLAQGILTGKYGLEERPSGGIRRFNPVFRKSAILKLQTLIKVLDETAKARGRSITQVALNWLVCKGAVPIPGAKRVSQARENAGALGWRLTDNQVKEIEEAAIVSGIRKQNVSNNRLVRMVPSSLIRVFVRGRPKLQVPTDS